MGKQRRICTSKLGTKEGNGQFKSRGNMYSNNNISRSQTIGTYRFNKG